MLSIGFMIGGIVLFAVGTVLFALNNLGAKSIDGRSITTASPARSSDFISLEDASHEARADIGQLAAYGIGDAVCKGASDGLLRRYAGIIADEIVVYSQDGLPHRLTNIDIKVDHGKLFGAGMGDLRVKKTDLVAALNKLRVKHPDPTQKTAFYAYGAKNVHIDKNSVPEGYSIAHLDSVDGVWASENTVRGQEAKFFPEPSLEMAQLSPDVLQARTAVLIAEMRRNSNINEKKFQSTFRPRAIALVGAMLTKLGGGLDLSNYNPDSSLRRGADTIWGGKFVGPSPMLDAAEFLEYLAAKLEK